MSATRRSLILVISLLLLSCLLLVNAAPIQLVEFSNTAESTSKTLEKRAYSGDGTWYTPGLGSCGWDNSESQLVAALNADQMGNGGNPNKNPKCGKKAKVTYKGKSVTVKIVDTCPTCSHGSLDLSPAAFKRLAPLSVGRIPIKFSFV
ncbi:hypothetical protein VTP01DRAFT_2730 [Rhizomucor pusillus]|uniref:uncharacterized protein n=1 Tax=Rhizomucor pusillus TaxID=4840 RepID=UPI0037431B71